MSNSADRPVRYANAMERLNWSHTEKLRARKAFEAALANELEDTVQQAKKRVQKITKASELWDLESGLGKRRRAIDEKYDYRYSVLPRVLAQLMCEERLSEADLNGLAAEKLHLIQTYVQFMKG